MKERPILFSGDMVRSTLEGRKKQTRRVVKNRHNDFLQLFENGNSGYFLHHNTCKSFCEFSCCDGLSPFGDKGDRLWVRETWCADPKFDAVKPSLIQKGSDIWYRAQADDDISKWRPSIFMPRWASRITLEITGVRVEMLQDISEEDAVKEGIENVFVEIPPMPSNDFDGDWRYDWKDYLNIGEHAGWNGDAGSFMSPKDSFESLWNSINGKDETKNWDANPLVWVIEFERIEQ
jgi:hypothetical protein